MVVGWVVIAGAASGGVTVSTNTELSTDVPDR